VVSGPWLSAHGPYDRLMPKTPEYASIAETLKAEVLAGRYDNEPLPGTAALAQRFDVNLKTAARAVQHLVAEGVLTARPGMSAIPVPPELRATKWPMTGRYARARAAQDLIFAGDVSGTVRKDTIDRDWVKPPAVIARLLNIDTRTRVFQRRSRTYVSDVVTEETSMFFPEIIVQEIPGLEGDERIQVVRLVEQAGHLVSRTSNEIRARHANEVEQEVFSLQPNGIVIEHSHGTYDADGVAVEAVINVRPASGNVITFDTDESPFPAEDE
jgi:GntR family transcriptional regulator